MFEHKFLPFVGLFFTSLTRVKEVKRRKRVQGDSKSPCRTPGLCAFCTYGPKVVREVASVLFLSAERKVKVVGEGGVRLRMVSSRDFGAIALRGENVEPCRDRPPDCP